MKVLITRDKAQALDFAREIEKYGFIPVFFPTIEITEPDSWDDVDEKINQIDEYTDLIFTSANAVRFFFERFKKYQPIERLKSKKIHVVGAKTKIEVEKYGLLVEPLPERSDKESLFGKILSDEVSGRKFLFPRGNLSDEEFIESARRKGIDIDDVVVYRTIKPNLGEDLKQEVKSMLESGEIGVVTFFSPSSVRNFVEIFGDALLRGQRIAVIGGTTLKACEELGLKVDINPMEFNPKPDGAFLAKLLWEVFKKNG
jgi:uroporphyrinogen III methyltransferase/synthase